MKLYGVFTRDGLDSVNSTREDANRERRDLINIFGFDPKEVKVVEDTEDNLDRLHDIIRERNVTLATALKNLRVEA